MNIFLINDFLYLKRWYRERDGVLTDLQSSSSAAAHASKSRVVGVISSSSTSSNSGGSKSSSSSSSAHLGAILLTQVRAEDSASFVCRVNNSISTETARVKLSVYGK